METPKLQPISNKHKSSTNRKDIIVNNVRTDGGASFGGGGEDVGCNNNKSQTPSSSTVNARSVQQSLNNDETYANNRSKSCKQQHSSYHDKNYPKIYDNRNVGSYYNDSYNGRSRYNDRTPYYENYDRNNKSYNWDQNRSSVRNKTNHRKTFSRWDNINRYNNAQHFRQISKDLPDSTSATAENAGSNERNKFSNSKNVNVNTAPTNKKNNPSRNINSNIYKTKNKIICTNKSNKSANQKRFSKGNEQKNSRHTSREKSKTPITEESNNCTEENSNNINEIIVSQNIEANNQNVELPLETEIEIAETVTNKIPIASTQDHTLPKIISVETIPSVSFTLSQPSQPITASVEAGDILTDNPIDETLPHLVESFESIPNGTLIWQPRTEASQETVSAEETVDQSSQEIVESVEATLSDSLTQSLKDQINNSNTSDCESNANPPTPFPKISLIPLSRLIRNELLNLTEDNIISHDTTSANQTTEISSTTPTKLPFKPNLIHRRRKISSCSNSSNTTETLVDKVVNMDKMCIKNVINSSGTKYDEALKLQARKRLREEIRKQLKSMNLERPKDSSLGMNFVPDDIVDSLYIPEVVLEEIRKAFGIDISSTSEHTEDEAVSNAMPNENEPNIEAESSVVNSERNQIQSPEASTNGSQPPRNNLMRRLKTAEQMKAAVEKLTGKPSQIGSRRFTKELSVSQTQTRSPVEVSQSCSTIQPKQKRSKSPAKSNERTSRRSSTPRSATLKSETPKSEILKIETPKSETSKMETPKSAKPKSVTPKSSTQRSATPKNITPKSATPKSVSSKKSATQRSATSRSVTPKNVTPRSTTPTIPLKKRNRRVSEVIVIDSSSSSTSSSSSSSESSSDSDSDSNTSVKSTSSSVKRRRLKLRVDAENVIDSFEKLILSSISESLARRYRTKYSNCTYMKLLFISCICTSEEYNSKKFTKIEIVKIQRNLKAEDRTIALEFLMREIVNVFNKQKEDARRDGSKQSSSNKNAELMKPQSTQNKRDAEHEPHTAIKSKNANTAENSVSVDGGKMGVKGNKNQIPSTSKHQSVKEQTLMTTKTTSIGGKNAGTANQNLDERNAATDYDDDDDYGDDDDVDNGDDDEKDAENPINKISSSVHKEQNYCKSKADNGEKNCSDYKANMLPIPSLSSSLDLTSITFPGGVGLDSMPSVSGISSLASISQYPNFPSIDLDALKQQSIFGEIVVSNLHEIDMKLMELQKRKMFIDEMMLKLQKEKMETDLLCIKLQNEKFMLLNTAVTINATSAVVGGTKEVSIRSTKKTAKEKVNSTETANTTPQKTIPKKRVYRKKLKPNPEVSATKKKATPKTVQARKPKTVTAVTQLTAGRLANKRKFTTVSTTEPKNKRQARNREMNKAAENDPVVIADCNQTPTATVAASLTTQVSAVDESTSSESTEEPDNTDIPSGYLEGIKSPITQIRVFENYIVASSEDGNLYKFNIKTLKLEKQFAKHSEAVTQMYLCAEKKVLYTTSLDGYLKKTSIENFELDIQSLYLQEPLQSIEVQWGIAYIGSRWGNIFTYDVGTNNLGESLLCSSDSSIIAIKATKEGPRKILIVSSKGNFINFRDATTGLLLRSLDVPENLNIYSILLDYGCVYCGTQKKDIYKFDFTTGALLATSACGNGAVSMRLYKNKFIFVGCYDGFIYVLDKETGSQVDRFTGSGKMVLTLEIVGDKLITSAKDNTMKIIDIPSHIINTTSN